MKLKKQKLIKIVISIAIFIFCLLALADILSGGEPLVDEFIILGLGITWFVYLKRPFKPPKFLIAFIVFIVFLASVVLHNIISHLAGFEEPVFFFLTILSFVASVILLLTFLFKKIFKKVKKFIPNY